MSGWRVHLPTSDATVVRFACPAPEPAHPWPLSAALTELLHRGAVRAERPRALGRGRGAPLLHSQELVLDGCPVVLEAQTGAGWPAAEVTLSLPAWDELATGVGEEAWVWELVDGVAAGVAARFGSIGDGEALELTAPTDWTALLRRHTGLLLAEREAAAVAKVACAYAELPRSGLWVVLR